MSAEREKLRYVIEHSSGNIGDICAEIYYEFLHNNSQNAPDLFRMFLELSHEAESDQTMPVKQYFSTKEYSDAFDKVRPLSMQVIENLAKENMEEIDFYRILWENISNKAFFHADVERICAILFALMAPQIPYFHLQDPISMDNDEYKKICKIISKDYRKAVFATRCGYEQHTEVASQLISIYESIPGDKEKLVYVARLLNYFNARMHSLYEKLSSNNEEAQEE